jgi:hypothetical protein
MSEATAQRLAEIAEAMSTPKRKVSPMQVAAQLLEEALGRVEAQAGVVPLGAPPKPQPKRQRRKPADRRKKA